MKYRKKKLLVIPQEHSEDLTKENLKGVEAYNNTPVQVEPLSVQGYNFILTQDNKKLFRVPVSWLINNPKGNKMQEFKQYKRVAIAELRPVTDDELMTRKLAGNISISPEDKEMGSPFAGDMIARNPKNHNDQWLVAKKYFQENFEEIAEEEEVKDK